jgi:C4-dicarboxylate-specific signal transduction histidine kinase
MTASIAHEIRQPLTAIVSSANAGLNWLKRTPPSVEEAREALENVIGQGHRLDDVVMHMRAMFQKVPGPRTRCAVNDLVRQVLPLADGQLAPSEVTLKTTFAEPSPVVLADSIQLQQVVLNLIVNAVEAMVHVPFGSRTLHVTTGTEDGQAFITVEDSGPGIDEQTLKSIFDPFFTTKPEGMGMGLSICKSIVEAHGGGISARAPADGGASFRVAVPLIEGGPA